MLLQCGIGTNDEWKYIALAPKNHPIIDQLTNSLETQLSDPWGMKVMLFDSWEDIMKYTGDENYELADNKPGVCFGVSLEINEGLKYETYYHFDD